MHPEKTKIMSRAQSGHDQPLFGNGRRRFFQHLGNEVKSLAILRQPPARHAIIRQFAFVRGLHGGNGAGFRRGDLDQLPRATAILPAQIKMIADQQQERARGR